MKTRPIALAAILALATLVLPTQTAAQEWISNLSTSFRQHAANAATKISLCTRLRRDVIGVCTDLARREVATSTAIVRTLESWGRALADRDSDRVAEATLNYMHLRVRWEEIVREDWAENYFRAAWDINLFRHILPNSYDAAITRSEGMRDNFCPTLDEPAKDECAKGWGEQIDALRLALRAVAKRSKALEDRRKTIYHDAAVEEMQAAEVAATMEIRLRQKFVGSVL